VLPCKELVATAKMALALAVAPGNVFSAFQTRTPRLAVRAELATCSASWCMVTIAVGMITFIPMQLYIGKHIVSPVAEYLCRLGLAILTRQGNQVFIITLSFFLQGL
jgi:hypothetical protein